jgi:hypothetical protein
MEFLGLALGHDLMDEGYGIFVITNGSVKPISLALARLAKYGVISAELSRDSYHNQSMVDPVVVKAFEAGERRHGYSGYGEQWPHDRRGIRNVDNSHSGPAKQGRCDWGDESYCVCDTFVVKPDGRVRQCGCNRSPYIGDVREGFVSLGWDAHGSEECCYKQIKERRKHGQTEPIGREEESDELATVEG